MDGSSGSFTASSELECAFMSVLRSGRWSVLSQHIHAYAHRPFYTHRHTHTHTCKLSLNLISVIHLHPWGAAGADRDICIPNSPATTPPLSMPAGTTRARALAGQEVFQRHAHTYTHRHIHNQADRI